MARRNKKKRYGGNRQSREKFYTKKEIFISRMASILQEPKGKVTQRFSQRDISAIRLNPLLGDPKKTKEILQAQELEMEAIPWAENGYFIHNMDKSELAKLQSYKTGLFYIQNASSMIAAVVLNPNEREKVLDMCAAPGSKTTHLSALMNNKGELIANDIDVYRSGKLRNILHMFGVRNAEVRTWDGGEYGAREQNRYDKILLDAPCSGEGMLYFGGDNPLRQWSIKKVKIMVKKQRELLESAYEALAPGGTLVYSTCTLEPEENEGVITHLLSVYPDAKIEKIDLFNSPAFAGYKEMLHEGITHWNGIDYSKRVKNTYRIIPSSKMMGFYFAKIVKR
jgi:16S rRNA (cytosine1407-C5)-methyltransferase